MNMPYSLDVSSLHPIDRGFVRDFLEQGIQTGTRIRSVTNTVREVVFIQCNDAGVPLRMLTKVISSTQPGEHKNVFTIREVSIGLQKGLVWKEVQRVMQW